jgi:hypothetical protein
MSNGQTNGGGPTPQIFVIKDKYDDFYIVSVIFVE